MTQRILRYAGPGLAFTAAFAAVAALPVISNGASSHALPAQVQAFDAFEASPVMPQDAGAKFAALHLETSAAQRDNLALSGLPVLNYSAIKNAEFAQSERMCMAEAIYYESRSDPLSGQKAVAEVVMNRVVSKHFPNTVCGVVYEGSERSTGCQFSFTCDGSLDTPAAGKAWGRSVRIADYALSGAHKPMTAKSTHYHTMQVNPVWSGTLTPTRNIGSHQFYRFKTRRERDRDIALAP